MAELFSDNQMKTQMNNLWSYLDDLAEKNPEEYKNFISQQFKKGLAQKESDKKDEKQDSEKNFKVTPYLGLRYKILIILQESSDTRKKDDIKLFDINNKNEISEIPKIVFSPEFQTVAYSKKIIQEPKIYLNIVHSSEYSLPTDDTGNPLKNPKNDSKWRFIPTQIRYNGKKKSMSGKRCDFYDVIINSIVVEKMKSDDVLKRSILAYMTKKFCIHLENENCIRLYTDNVKILEGKKYKSLKGIPEDFKITPQKSTQSNPDPQNISAGVDAPIAKNFLEENKINIPIHSENFPNTSTFYNIPKTKENKKVKNNSKIKDEPQSNPKSLIQEVKQMLRIIYHKEIVSVTTMKVHFDFSNFENICMNNIDLEISADKLKINLIDSKYKEEEDFLPLNMKFDFTVDAEKCTAKLNNSNKILTVDLHK